MPTLTEAQFECLAGLLRSRGRSRVAAKRVLVAGERSCDVARSMSVDPALVRVSLRVYRRAHRDVLDAFVTVVLSS